MEAGLYVDLHFAGSGLKFIRTLLPQHHEILNIIEGKMTKVTEHNLTEWKLNESELNELIRLTKEQLKNHSDDVVTQNFYGIMLGKLIIMKND